MANLTGMPISSLPETTLQEGDQVVGYRAETGKAYRTDLADQIADLTEQVNQLNQSLTDYNILDLGTEISSGDNLNDYTTVGVYRVTDSSVASNVTNTPTTNTGYKLLVIYTAGQNSLMQIALLAHTNTTVFQLRTKLASSGWTAWRTVAYA